MKKTTGGAIHQRMGDPLQTVSTTASRSPITMTAASTADPMNPPLDPDAGAAAGPVAGAGTWFSLFVVITVSRSLEPCPSTRQLRGLAQGTPSEVEG
jgi:hypothetical protein